MDIWPIIHHTLPLTSEKWQVPPDKKNSFHADVEKIGVYLNENRCIESIVSKSIMCACLVSTVCVHCVHELNESSCVRD